MDARDRHYVADAAGRTPASGFGPAGGTGETGTVNARRCGKPPVVGPRDAADEGGGADDAIR
ncbi:hypothetical protein Acsp04_02790 [Actinomadura sp. NBRC 104425]|nr:hypothetical protein Acsp04_02790 [Actinomadura sp. NBRC 104425]